MNDKFVLINDTLVPEHEASISISDLSIQRGYGIFDFFKTLASEPVFLDDHLDRFYYSAAQMKLPVSRSRQDLKDLLYCLIRKNDIPQSGIRITLTGGYSADGFNIAEPNLIVTQQPFQINKEQTERGISLITYDYQRQFSDAKTLDYLKAIWLQPVIREQKADDVLYHDSGYLRECPRANFFMVTADERILTAGSGILKGITRKHVLKVSGKLYVTEETDISLDELKNSREAFITSTTKNILPVIQIDGKVLGDGRPGKITQTLSNEYNTLIYG